MTTSQLLFPDDSKNESQTSFQPLADRLRPSTWENFCGISQIGASLAEQLKKGEDAPPSLILWGPPGSGKTTIAKLIGNTFCGTFIEFSAVLGGVKEVREIVAQAKVRKGITLLFVDEVHRFNKSQQDAFLPHIENGTIVFIGATTENPSFALNNALLSRTKVVKLAPLTKKSLFQILEAAESSLELTIEQEAKEILVEYGSGDARKTLNLLENIINGKKSESSTVISGEVVKSFLGEEQVFSYDRDGEEHYNLISAFIKSLRGSDPDAALYWGFRMLESGEPPRFLFRRLIIFAAEDVGNADPRALQLAIAAADAFERVGFPEGRIPLAQCITYLASVPKSNRSYEAMHRALKAVSDYPSAAVPLHLRNAPTKLLKSLDYGKGYRYPHSEEGAYADGVRYLPEEMGEQVFYEPSSRGLEAKILEMQQLREKKEKR